ncbi:hypothetical protein TOT_020000993 [Theileria orientalis strain Shintoku]|uniref:Uncharacterized protein n=1 Tax=Theileria orientalis strain Shintoku TaxID=869250 RepID=J4C8G3_THEOR|nr:hypothetical protein TOT_020000993 [Theileria orientalis strain Shintoku]BAM40738.1 hypothetical protein TOT_020000993 [Theileria orientalis strain Shintoku]|eukprot:XP_009691039.1 hypothetical protein TOT_020000993 [Theileria orientalis strain Shintoku]
MANTLPNTLITCPNLTKHPDTIPNRHITIANEPISLEQPDT